MGSIPELIDTNLLSIAQEYCHNCRWYKAPYCTKYRMLTKATQTCKAFERDRRKKHGK